jgi:methylated-DNA-protein-cysteine methyltransferase related protein
MPRHARLVGRTLANLPNGSRLPWHRVVNASLRISERGDDRAMLQQRRRLEREGVVFIGPRVARAHLWDY